MSDPQARLQALSEEFQKLQGGKFSTRVDYTDANYV
jgi:hypothetical protein